MLRFFESKKTASQYAKYRPDMSQKIAECVMNFCKTHQDKETISKPLVMVDVGCGSGQSVNIFHSYFDKIKGIDVSLQQLDQAKTQNTFKHVEYVEGSAENLPIETDTVDLITANTAAHWFDLPQFFQEVKRVLKPSGCLAITGYCDPTLRFIPRKSDDALAQKATNLSKSFYQKCARGVPAHIRTMKHFSERYKDIYEAIPFLTKERNDSIHIRSNISINGLCGFMSSVSSYQTYMEKEMAQLKENNLEITEDMMLKIDPLQEFSQNLMQLWGLEEETMDKEIIELDYHWFVLLAKV